MDKLKLIIFSFVSSAIRQGSLLVAPFLLEKFHYDLNSPSAGVYVTFIATFAATYIWAVLEKNAWLTHHQHIVEAALQLPAGSTVDDAVEKAKENKLIAQGNI